jgi:hemerythrin-like domain-containing protein
MEVMRYNMFSQIHKGLRAWLFEAGLRIQRTDFSNKHKGLAIVAELKQIIKVLQKHTWNEDNNLFPRVEAVAPFVIALFEQEHEKDNDLAKKMQSWLDKYTDAVTEKERLKSGIGILHTFNEFTAFNLQHMNKEEMIVNELLWAHYTDKEIQEITAGIIRNQNPEDSILLGKWMIKGMNDVEIINWLKHVSMAAPDYVLEGILIMAEQELEPARWELIEKNFSDIAAVAA